MTTFLEFLAGNVLALGVVGVLAVLTAAVFALGGDDATAPYPTRPVLDRGDLAASTDPVAVVGTPVPGDVLDAPFTGADAVAFQVDVGGPLGHVATLRAGREFEVDVDGERVTVRTGERPVVADDRVVARRRLDADAVDDELDATTRESLDAFDAARSTLSWFLSGSVLPTRSHRTYAVRAVSPDDDVAVVGYLRDDAADGWVLEAPESVRFLDPDAVVRDDWN